MNFLSPFKDLLRRCGAQPGRNAATSKSHRAINGRLINPFAGKSRPGMTKLIEDFRQETDLDINTALLTKGALLAQDDDAFSEDREHKDGLALTDKEREALHLEDTQRFNQPFQLYALIGACSAGAAVQGWDETVANQAQQWYITYFGLKSSPTQPGLTLAIINSAPWLAAGTVGVFLTDSVNCFAGRRGALFTADAISFIACIFQAATFHPYQMILSRILLGIGVGLKSTTAPIYAAESTPRQIRGGFTMFWQLWTAFGLMCGYVSGVIFAQIPDLQGSRELRWRLTMGSPALLPLLICAFIYTLPESPRWLILKALRGNQHCYEKAFNALIRLRGRKILAVRDLFLIYHQVKAEEMVSRRRNRFVELFIVPRNRRALAGSVLTMWLQQFCGVNALAYYSSLVFLTAICPDKECHISSPDFASSPKYLPALNKALRFSFGFGLINFVFAIPAIFLIDRLGRRPLLLFTLPFMAVAQLFTGISFQFRPEAVKICVPFFAYFFDVFYSLGTGPVPFVYASESMPLYVRDLGMSVATSVNWILNWLLAFTFTNYWNHMGPTGTFCFFAAFCLLGFFLILFFLPETQGKSLEALDATFSIPTRVHAAHGWAQFKWALGADFLFRRARPPKLDVSIEYPPSTSEKPRRRRMRKVQFDRSDERLFTVPDVDSAEAGMGSVEHDGRYD